MKTVSILSLLLLVSSCASAEAIYKWRDDEGKLHFSSSPRVLTPEVEEVQLQPMPADPYNAHRKKNLLRQKQYELEAEERKKELTYQKQQMMLQQEERDKKLAEINAASNKKLCEKYKDRYQRYRDDGVMGYNILTGEKELMRGEAARRTIEFTKETKDLFCE